MPILELWHFVWVHVSKRAVITSGAIPSARHASSMGLVRKGRSGQAAGNRHSGGEGDVCPQLAELSVLPRAFSPPRKRALGCRAPIGPAGAASAVGRPGPFIRLNGC